MSETGRTQPRATGGCLCNGVRYEVRGEMRDAWVCHCGQCRKTHGHYAAYSRTRREDLTLTDDRTLTWYASSRDVRRGFCRECGASLFFDRISGDGISIAAGTLDAPTGLRTAGHIFVADAGDYYEIDHPVGYPGSMRG